MKNFAFILAALLVSPLAFADDATVVTTNTTTAPATTKASLNDLGPYVAVNANFDADYEGDNNAGIGFPIRFGYDFHRNFGAEAETGWHFFDFEEHNADLGHRHMIPLIANIVGRAPVTNSFVPYAVAGTGIYFFGSSGNDEAEDVDISNAAWGFKTGAGADYYLTENVAFNMETGFHFIVDPDVTARVAGVETEQDSDVDTWYIGAGLKFKI